MNLWFYLVHEKEEHSELWHSEHTKFVLSSFLYQLTQQTQLHPLRLTFPDNHTGTVSKVWAEQRRTERHKVQQPLYMSREGAKWDLSRGSSTVSDRELTRRASVWHKNRWYQQIWQPVGQSRCKQRLNVKVPQNLHSLKEIHTLGVITERSEENTESQSV